MGAGVRLGGWNIDGYAYGQGNYVRITRRVTDGSETSSKCEEGRIHILSRISLLLRLKLVT